MLSRARLCLSPPTRDVAKPGATPPALSPAVVRSLYRQLYRHVRRMDAAPVEKVLFPLTKELQEAVGRPGPLYAPGGPSYTQLLRDTFRRTDVAPKINVAFDTLNRLRAHHENVQARLPQVQRDRAALKLSLADKAPATRQLYRAQVQATAEGGGGPRYIPSPVTRGAARVVLKQQTGQLPDLCAGTVLVAHPLSSTHVDRRVMILTERTPFTTSALVLDLLYTYPLSRGNMVFPEVFWGHDVHDGGFNQIGFTMPPTAQIAILHTLEPPAEEEVAGAGGGGAVQKRWRQWYDAAAKKKAKSGESGAAATTPRQHHELLCRTLIPGGVLDDGTREPSLYLSSVEALPYLARLAEGRPRSHLRIYWGSMRWSTAQIEAEVQNGHWIAARVSPSFFAPYDIGQPAARKAAENFPTAEELRRARETRETRYGADVSLPQVFPPDQVLRIREPLWDQIMHALGGEFDAIVGCSNPFAAAVQSGPQILADLPLSGAAAADALLDAVSLDAGEGGEGGENAGEEEEEDENEDDEGGVGDTSDDPEKPKDE